MKRIPAANVEFWMGPSEGDAGIPASDWNSPRLGEHRLKAKLTSDFYIGIFELTQKQYAMLMDDARPAFYDNDNYWTNRPLENTAMETMLAANGFLDKAGTFFGKAISLPTEAQWEFTAKAMYDGVGYSSGLAISDANTMLMEGNISKRGHNTHDDTPSVGGTWPVGLGAPNPFGIYNMYGNVAEFMIDKPWRNLATHFGWTSGGSAIEDPACTTQETSLFGSSIQYYVYKGGSFNAELSGGNRRSAWRGAAMQGAVKNSANIPLYGYRLVCPGE